MTYFFLRSSRSVMLWGLFLSNSHLLCLYLRNKQPHLNTITFQQQSLHTQKWGHRPQARTGTCIKGSAASLTQRCSPPLLSVLPLLQGLVCGNIWIFQLTCRVKTFPPSLPNSNKPNKPSPNRANRRESIKGWSARPLVFSFERYLGAFPGFVI